jgi:hypothetical protein
MKVRSRLRQFLDTRPVDDTDYSMESITRECCIFLRGVVTPENHAPILDQMDAWAEEKEHMLERFPISRSWKVKCQTL